MTDGSLDMAFKRRVGRWARKLDVRFRSISLRSMTHKWASCSTSGRFTFDTGVLKLPPRLQDFIVVHELLHFHVPNHGRLWKSLMTAHLGNYQKLESALKNAQSKSSS
jgi:predicted metal-dependent hydrolase